MHKEAISSLSDCFCVYDVRLCVCVCVCVLVCDDVH